MSTLRKGKEIATVGDRNPVDHGGGVVFERDGKYILVYIRMGLSDLPGEFIVEDEDGGEGETPLDVVFLELPSSFEEFDADYGSADWETSIRDRGEEDSRRDFEEILRKMRFAKTPEEFVKLVVWPIEWLLQDGVIDNDSESLTANDAEELFRTGMF